MSHKSRRARARLLQEQASIVKLKSDKKQLEADKRKLLNDVVDQSVLIRDMRAQITVLQQTVEKHRRKDVIVCKKSDVDTGIGPRFAIQVIIDAKHLELSFRTPSRRQSAEFEISEMKSVGAYASRLAYELTRRIERGIEDILTGNAVREEVL